MKKSLFWIYLTWQLLLSAGLYAQELQIEPTTNRSTGKPVQASETPDLELLDAYRDTIRILKNGIYSYEQLFREQQAFIDTLLDKMEEQPGKTTRRPSPSQNTLWKDSVMSLKEERLVQQHRIEKLQLERDSLKIALSDTKKAEPEITTLQIIPTVPSPAERESEDVPLQQQSQEQLASAREVYQREMKVMRERYYKLEKSYSQLKRITEEQQANIEELQRKLNASGEAINRETGRANATVELAHTTHRRLRSELKDTENQLREAEAQIAKDKANLAALFRELEETRHTAQYRLAEWDKTEKRLSQAHEDYRNLEIEKNRRIVDFREMGKRLDSTLQRNASLQHQNQELQLRQDSLYARIELLSPYTESAKARRRVYQQQLEHLSQLQNRLPREEQALHAREKLLQQRENIVKEENPEAQLTEALELVEELTRKNEQLIQQISSVDRGAGGGFGELYSATHYKDSRSVPVFCRDTRMSELALRDYIEQYFLEQGQQPLSKTPLVYQRVGLPSGNFSLVKVTFEIGPALSNGWRQLACIVQRSDGRYYDAGQPGIQQAVDQLLEEIFP